MCNREVSKQTCGKDVSTVRRRQSKEKRPSIGRGHVITDRRFEDQFTVRQKVLGDGFNGQVKVATGKDGRTRALKSYQKTGMAESELADLHQEIDVHLSLDHPHVVRVESVFESDDDVHIVMEHLRGGELYTRLMSEGALGEDRAADVARQVTLALAYLHAHRVVHRDLKLENLVFEDSSCKCVKLIDFGLATHWDGHTPLTKRCGTTLYSAPEVCESEYTDQVDMWALGVLTHELVLLSPPFQEDPSFCSRFHERLSSHAQDFIRLLLNPSPAQRLTATAALAHPWLSSVAMTDAAQVPLILQTLCDFAQAPRFRRACLAAMTSSVPVETHAALRGHFKALDSNNDGAITLSELQEAMAKAGLSNEEAEQLFQVLDANCDGEITYSEFLAGALHGYALQAAVCHDVFLRFDTNRNGVITADGLRSVFEGSVYHASVEDLIQEADRKGTGKLTLGDFLSFLRPNAKTRAGIHAKPAVQVKGTFGLSTCLHALALCA
mmetsp:Transcript_70695/g.133446  ORF Transcript_70695/g.133446 Transcript_70695/m.133446 type:complete len:496 (+) Transcript_70695:57-1544(+)